MAIVKEILSRRKELSLKKVVAYCYVSTKTREQLDSLAAQENYYFFTIKEYIIKLSRGLITQHLVRTHFTVILYELPDTLAKTIF